MKKRRILSILLCLALIVFSLSGCSKTSSKKSTSSNKADSSKLQGMIKSVDVDKKQITIATMPSGNQSPSKPDGDGANNNDNGTNSNESNDSGTKNNDANNNSAGDNGKDNGNQPPAKPDGDDKNNNDGNSANDSNTKSNDTKSNSANDSGTKSNDTKSNSANDSSTKSSGTNSNSANDGKDNGNQPPSKPDGDSNAQMPQQEETVYKLNDESKLMDKDGNTITLKKLSEGDFVEFTAKNSYIVSLSISDQTKDQGEAGGGNGSSQPTEYSAVTQYSADKTISNESQSSTGKDENIAWISDGAKVTMSGITATKKSSNSTGGDQSSFYGVGAAYLVTDGTLNISDSKNTTDANGGAGVFAYGKGVANVSNTTIKTTKDTSGGIHVAGGGTLNAKNLNVETDGESSAAIRSDRGSGTMKVEGGTYTTNGTGSPAVYSTANISVSDAILNAESSEAVCIEGKNSLNLSNCRVTSNMPDNSQNDCKWSVILYQSMSGDSEEGNSTFTMKDGSLTSKSGGLFYTTNTSSTFTLENVKISTTTTPDFFLKCTGNSNKRGWGSSGQNGADCKFTAKNQEMVGDVIWDSISKLNMSITSNSKLQGAFVNDESNVGNGGDGYANLSIDKNSTWVVTDNSALSKLTCKGKIVDSKGNKVTVVDSSGKVLHKGTSEYKITVDQYNE